MSLRHRIGKNLIRLLFAMILTMSWQGVVFAYGPGPDDLMGGVNDANNGATSETTEDAPPPSPGEGHVDYTRDDDSIPGLIGLSSEYMSTGIGAGFLGSLLGADTFSKINIDITNKSNEGGGNAPDTSTSFEGNSNKPFEGLLKMGAYLGAAVTTILVLFHGFVMFFNKMEYGDVMGEAKDRFIGFTRAALAFGLVMPVASGGLATAQYVVGYAAVASNGIGNRAAETVMLSGFGSADSPMNIMSANHEVQGDLTAETYAQMVGQQTCVNQMQAAGARPTEIQSRCSAAVIGGGQGEDYEDVDVGYDDESADRETDAEYCDEMYGKGLFTGSDGEETYLRTSCKNIREKQRETYDRITEISENHDGSLDSPEAQEELEVVAGDLQKQVTKEIEDINKKIAEETGSDAEGGFESGTYLGDEMTQFIRKAGWPGLGLVYSAVGGQMDAVSGLQAMNGSQSEGFSLDQLQGAGRQANSAIRQARTNSVRAAGSEAIQNNTETETDDAGGISNWFSQAGEAFGAGAEWVNEFMQKGMRIIFKPAFEDPGPVATHKIGSVIIGGLIASAVAIDAANLVSKFLPMGKALKGAKKLSSGVKGFFSKMAEKGPKKQNDGFLSGGSILVNLITAYAALLGMLILLVASFLVLIIPKIPVFLVSFLALEWAIWCAIVIFGSPLWVALNMTTIGNQPGIFTQRALSGLGVLLYIVLFPAMVVAAVVISAMAYNMIIPVLSTMLMMTFSGGIVEMMLGIFAMPLVMLIGLMVGAFVSITAISRIPSMITNYLGVSAPGGSVSESINTFVASPTSFSNVTNPQSMIAKGGASALAGKAGKGAS